MMAQGPPLTAALHIGVTSPSAGMVAPLFFFHTDAKGELQIWS
jgi:hypothetical protein